MLSIYLKWFESLTDDVLADGDRYWVLYGLDGQIAALYRLSKTGSYFHRWNGEDWVDCADRYLRVTQDVDSDEVSTETAKSFIKSRRNL